MKTVLMKTVSKSATESASAAQISHHDDLQKKLGWGLAELRFRTGWRPTRGPVPAPTRRDVGANFSRRKSAAFYLCNLEINFAMIIFLVTLESCFSL